MEEYYERVGKSADLSNQVEVGRIYAVKYDGEWHRVRPVTVDHDFQVTMFRYPIFRCCSVTPIFFLKVGSPKESSFLTI